MFSRSTPALLPLALFAFTVPNAALAAPAEEAPPEVAEPVDAEAPPSEAIGEAPDSDPGAPVDAASAPEDTATTDSASEDPPAPTTDGDTKAVAINPTQGSEARSPKQKIQIPVDIGDKHSITYTNLLAPRINPLGLENRLWIGYQYRLYSKDKAILNGSNIGLFFRPVLSPAIALIGATLQIQPAAVFRFRATYSYVQYFGTFQYFQSYQTPIDDFSDTQLNLQKDNGENYVIGGHQIELEALVQARYKGLVIRSATTGIYNTFGDKVRDDDDLFYAVRYDALAPTKGWMLNNDTDVMWLQDLKGPRHASILAGARATTVMPFYTDEVYSDTDDPTVNPNGPQFRLGPALGYIFYDRPDRFPRFNRPTLLVMPQWNLVHRWRTGQDVNQAMPTIVMAFVFTGQLWGRN